MRRIWHTKFNRLSPVWCVMADEQSQVYETPSLEEAYKAYKKAPLFYVNGFNDIPVDITKRYNTEGWWKNYQLVNNKYVAPLLNGVSYEQIEYRYNNKNYSLHALMEATGIEGITLSTSKDDTITPIPYKLSIVGNLLKYELVKIKIRMEIPTPSNTRSTVVHPIAHVEIEELNRSTTHTRHAQFQVHEPDKYATIGLTPAESLQKFKNKLLESIEYTNSLF